MLASHHFEEPERKDSLGGVCWSRELREAVCRSWPQQEATRSQPLMGRQGDGHGAGYGDSRSVGSIYKL